MGVQEIRPVGRPVADLLAHDGARGISPALARLEHLHGRANQVADRIDIRDGGSQLLIDDHGAAVVDGDTRAPRPPVCDRGRSPSALKHEVGVDLELARRAYQR